MSINTTSEKSLGLDRSEWAHLLSLGAQEVFAMMVGATLIPCGVPELPIFPEFTAMVGLAGPICGLFSVRCNSPAAVSIASAMLGTPVEVASPETRDALGEICNMVIGHFKHKVGEIGEASMLSVPTVVRGSDYRVRSLADSTVMESYLQLAEETILFRLNYKL